MLHQVADGEVGGRALSAVAELFSDLKCLVVGHIDHLGLVADALEGGDDQLVVCDGEPRHQQGGVGALGGREVGVDVFGVLLAVQTQAGLFFFGERGHLVLKLRALLSGQILDLVVFDDGHAYSV